MLFKSQLAIEHNSTFPMAGNPKSWNEYEQGGGSPRGSVGSLGNIHFDETAEREHLLHPGRSDAVGSQNLRRRRSV